MNRLRVLTALLLVFFLTSCLPALPGLVPTPTVTPFPTATSTTPPTETITPSPAPTATATEIPRPNITRVVIISIDGLRPDAIDYAPMPVLQGLIAQGAYSYGAQTIMPSTTLPSHSSMLTGLCPSAHGVTWNEYLPENGFAQGVDLFDLAHAAGLRTVMIVGKEKLRQVTEPESTDIFQWVNDPDPIIAKRIVQLIPNGFSLLFIHFPDPDTDGHEYGWMSFPQMYTLRRADAAIQSILDALDKADMRENTLIIVTADHGGHGTTHGYDIPLDMTIPWVAVGPGIQPKALTSAINTTDTAATAAWALGLTLPPEWAGHPVLEAFGFPDDAPRPQPRCP
jgi:arylsulfatase A-like enzyme